MGCSATNCSTNCSCRLHLYIWGHWPPIWSASLCWSHSSTTECSSGSIIARPVSPLRRLSSSICSLVLSSRQTPWVWCWPAMPEQLRIISWYCRFSLATSSTCYLCCCCCWSWSCNTKTAVSWLNYTQSWGRLLRAVCLNAARKCATQCTSWKS